MSRHHVAGLAALAGAALALAGCAAAGEEVAAHGEVAAHAETPTQVTLSPAPPRVGPASQARPSPATETTARAPAAPASTSSRRPAAPGACRTTGLTASVGHAGGAAGHIRLDVVLRNTGQARCVLYGYPKVVPLTSEGEPLADLTVSHAGSVVVPAVKPRPVVLAPGAKASFAVGYADVPTGDSPCPDAASMRVYPPGDPRALALDAPLNHVCGPKITVSPVVRGTHGPTP